MKVHRKLAPDSRYFIGPDLDRHLDAILQNSMAVAHVSRDRYSETILQLCSEVYYDLFPTPDLYSSSMCHLTLSHRCWH